MRLIDADALIERKFILHDMEELAHEEFEKLVNEQQTAYDVEKVVEGVQNVHLPVASQTIRIAKIIKRGGIE